MTTQPANDIEAAVQRITPVTDDEIEKALELFDALDDKIFGLLPVPVDANDLADILAALRHAVDKLREAIRAELSRVPAQAQQMPADKAEPARQDTKGEDLCPNGEPWDANPDGVKPGQERGQRMNRDTGLWE